MSIYKIQNDNKKGCFEKLKNGCGISCSRRGVGKLTVGSQDRCNNCVDDLSRIYPCTPDFGKEFKQEVGLEGLRSGKTMEKMGNFFKGLGKKPEELKLDHTQSDYDGVNWDPSEARHAAIKAAAKKSAAKKSATKKVKSIMDSENTLKTMSQGETVVPAAASMIENPVKKGDFDVNKFSGQPSDRQVLMVVVARKRKEN